ncbi:MAG: C39 family peptidase [Deltaproteobacteria bacterium]|nr:C39 family peptidase [Deltaproteobacteria bacterium]
MLFLRTIKWGLALAIVAALGAGCVHNPRRPVAKPFDLPQDSRLVMGVPFFPDDTNLCGPASLAATLTFYGYPTTVAEAAAGVQRWDIGGSLGPDLVLWARERGANARFFAADPDTLVAMIARQNPVIVQVDEGLGPIVKGHFMVIVGYNFEGVVANNGLIQQEIIPWSRFLTDWYAMGYFAIAVERETAEGTPAGNGGGDAPALPETGI